MTPVLLTERLLLRPFEHEDSQALAALLNDPDVARGVCASPLPFTALHASARILMMRAAEGRGDLAWAVEDATGELVGLVSLTRTGPNGALELGIAIRRTSWGQGLGREALEVVLGWVRKTRAGSRVVIEVFADTPAAIRLARALGFAQTGSSSRYSLARDSRDPVDVFARVA